MVVGRKEKVIPTHQLRTGLHEDVTAWRYLKDSPMPVWVFRAFHNLGGKDVLSHRNGTKVHPGEWIVAITYPNGLVAIILTDEEFNKCFVELPKING
jgi:hypothetical protein